MRILVTGGAGFIGSHIVDAYLAQGLYVAVVDDRWLHGDGRLANIPARIRYYATDITDPALSEVSARERPEIARHQAAQHSVRISTDKAALDAHVNILGLLNVLENRCVYGVTRLSSHLALPHMAPPHPCARAAALSGWPCRPRAAA